VTTPIGWLVFWVLVIFGVTLVGTITAALVAVIVNFLLKEGQGMGVSGFRDHVVVCGWNATARNLIRELRHDDNRVRIALIHSADRNPAGEGVYYVKGDPADAADLKRAGIEEAASAVVFPLEPAPDADMKSILVALTIRSLAPRVRVVAEVNDARHIDHFRRAGADELMVTSAIASRLLARSAIYPGLTDIVADLVATGGAELYGVIVPDDCVGLDFQEATFRMRTQHHATLVAVRRRGKPHFDPPREFELRADDVLVVIAQQLGRLRPAPHDEVGARPVAIEPAAPRDPTAHPPATVPGAATAGAPRGS
jgi:voltage-gated potassium channel